MLDWVYDEAMRMRYDDYRMGITMALIPLLVLLTLTDFTGLLCCAGLEIEGCVLQRE